MKKHIFIINGGAGVGKDTFCSMVATMIPTKVISSVDEVKVAAKFLGWKGDKTPGTRKLLSDLKDMSTLYFDGPMKYLSTCVEKFKHQDYAVLFMHIREPEEIRKAEILFDAESILIINGNVELVETNHADMDVHNHDYKYVIDNSGTIDDLLRIAETFVRGLKE